MDTFFAPSLPLVRPYWRCYYSNTDAIIYVVDSADHERIDISKTELHSMLAEEELKNSILMVFANKQVLAPCSPPSPNLSHLVTFLVFLSLLSLP